jgi:altronate dehydratase large subunit
MIGYKRLNKSVGIRNYVLIMSAADNVNPLAKKISSQIKNSIYLPASYGRGQLGVDHNNFLTCMAGLADNPNIFKTIIVSMDGDSADWIVNKSNRKKDIYKITFMKSFGIKDCIKQALFLEKKINLEKKKIKKVKFTYKNLVLGLECGGSDTTSGLVANPCVGIVVDKLITNKGSAIFSEPVECLGGEESLIKRIKRKSLKKKLINVIYKYQKIAADNNVNLTGINPTPDNIRGGLTTIEEKSLGAISKSGSKEIVDIIDFGNKIKKKGLNLLDAPAAAVENLTALSAAGCQIILFTTGGGNPVGNPISPTIKITANSKSFKKFKDLIDIDLSFLLNSLDYEKGSIKIEKKINNIINKSKTLSEKNKFLETNISRFGPSI